MKKTRVLKALLLLVVALTVGMGNAWAQEDINMYPPKVDIKDAEITEFGHLTMTVKDEVVVDSLTMVADTVCKVESIDWNTETGTAKKRMASRRRKAAATGSDFYDKDSNWWWDMWWFVFKYPSINAKGEPIVLSALACMPDDDCDYVNNVIIGCHATITANRECPSMNSHNKITDTNDTDFFMLRASSGIVFSSGQDEMPYYNLVIIPDYEGYGVTKDVPHPYLSEEITARQVVDGVRYGIELYKTSDKVKKVRHKFRDGWRSFCIGYSQGGGTAMAVHRFIEQNHLVDELNFSGSLCGAGPYNPMSTIMFYMDRARKNETMDMAVVMPLILKGMCDSNPYMRNHQVSDYLSELFLDTGILDWLASKDYSTGDVKEAWNKLREQSSYYADVVEKDGAAYMDRMMTADAYSYFLNVLDDNDDDIPNSYSIDPLSQPGWQTFWGWDYRIYAVDPPKPARRGVMEDLQHALSYNDLTKGWNPEHPLRLYHSYYDDVVPTSNRVSAGNAFGDWAEKCDPAVPLGHVNSAIEFLMGLEMVTAINNLAKAPIHPESRTLGDVEKIYKGKVDLTYRLLWFTLNSEVDAEFVLRKNAQGNTVAILGSGYNACTSQYFPGKVVVPATVELDGQAYPVGGVNDMAFRMCTELTHVTLPEGVERIGDFAFYGCRNLLEVDLPSTLKTIGSGAFIDLPNLQSVTCRAVTPPTWEYNDVFCFHEQGIGDINTYTTDNVMLWVADDQEDAYYNANFTNPEIGWKYADGWSYFGRLNIRSITDTKSEAYAVFTPADSTLAFYFDGRREARINRGERTFDLNGKDPEKPDQFPGWTDNTGGGYPMSSDDPEDHSKEIAHVVFTPSFCYYHPVTTAKWFMDCENLETIEGWKNLNTDEVICMFGMFDGCKKLTSDDFDFSNFNTVRCESFMYMFNGCTGLTSLDLSNFDTSSATQLTSMFADCTNLTSLEVSQFQTQNVTDFSSMFYNCSSLETLGLEKFVIKRNASTFGLFKNCSNLKKLSLPFTITSAENMFKGLDKLEDLYYYGTEPFASWAERHDIFLPDQQTRFHVLPQTVEAWKEKWPNDERERIEAFRVNATYVGDLGTEDCPIQIYTPAMWDVMGEFVEAGTTGIHAQLMADIKVTTMIGSSSQPFSGIFDGNGHTITCELSGGEFAAPFKAIGGATIKNLHVSGSITGNRHTGGIVGECVNGKGDNTITNCLVDASLYSNSIVGGIVGHGKSCNNTVTGCLFRGKLELDAANQDNYPYGADIMGWCDDRSKQTVKDCLGMGIHLDYNPNYSGLNFYYSSNGNGAFPGTNAYYCSSTNIEEGVVLGIHIQSLDKSLTPHRPGASTTYDVSGLTAYENGIVWNGELIGGWGQTVPVVFDVPNGKRISGVNYCTFFQGYPTQGDALQQDADGNYLVDLSEGSIYSPTYLMPNLELGVLHLYTDGDNSSKLIEFNEKTLDVVVEGRSLRKDGSWNMLSLPFDLSEEQIGSSPLAGCTLITLTEASLHNGALTLAFSDTTAISADKSYLVKWETTGVDIVNPLFSQVTISRSIPAGIKFELDSISGAMAFKGTYNPLAQDRKGETNIFLQLGADNLLSITEDPTTIKGTEAYLELYDVPTEVTMIGDINGDGDVNVSDVTTLVSIILGNPVPTRAEGASNADVNGDSDINVSDVTKLVNIILGNEPSSTGFNRIDAGDTGIEMVTGNRLTSLFLKKKIIKDDVKVIDPLDELVPAILGNEGRKPKSQINETP